MANNGIVFTYLAKNAFETEEGLSCELGFIVKSIKMLLDKHNRRYPKALDIMQVFGSKWKHYTFGEAGTDLIEHDNDDISQIQNNKSSIFRIKTSSGIYLPVDILNMSEDNMCNAREELHEFIIKNGKKLI